MGFCECTTKFLLFVFNLACALLGLVIVALGVMVQVQGNSIKTFFQSELSTTSIAFLVIGALVFIISFFGCCGVARESSCMITTYAVILSAILLIQVAIGVTAFVFNKNISSEVKKRVENVFEDSEHNKQLIDTIQLEWQCCGAHGPAVHTGLLPPSCCGNGNNILNCNEDQAYKMGCYEKVIQFGKTKLKTIGTAALVIAGVEFFCIAIACCMSSSIRRRERMMI